MIGRKIPGTGKRKLGEYDGKFKTRSRVARQKRRARRARKLRNGWVFGRKIRVGTQMYPVKIIDVEMDIPEPWTTVVHDEYGVEHSFTFYSCAYPVPKPKVVKPEPEYDDLFELFGDLVDSNHDGVVFTFGNEPGSIPIDAVSNVNKVGKAKRSSGRPLQAVSNINKVGKAKRSPAVSNVNKVGKAKRSPGRPVQAVSNVNKVGKAKRSPGRPLLGFGGFPQRSSVCVV